MLMNNPQILSSIMIPDKLASIFSQAKYETNLAKNISISYYEKNGTAFFETSLGDNCNATMQGANISFKQYRKGIEFDFRGTGAIPKLIYACGNERAMNFFDFSIVERGYAEPIYNETMVYDANLNISYPEMEIVGYDVKPQSYDYLIEYIPTIIGQYENCTKIDSKTQECLGSEMIDITKNFDGEVTFTQKSGNVSGKDIWVIDPLFIPIIKAEHLDANRTFISDIYEEVKEQDDVWSEVIGDGEYVRVTFEEVLDNTKDITLYARATNKTSEVEVYVEDGNESLAVFENISSEDWYKIYLTELDGTHDVFDLKVLGSVEFDYITDPETGGIFIIDGEDAGSTPWEFDSLTEDDSCTIALDSDAKHEGTYGYKILFDGVGDTAQGEYAFAEQTEMYVRFYIYIPSTFNLENTWDLEGTFHLLDGVSTLAQFGLSSMGATTPVRWAWAYEFSWSYDDTNFATDTWHYVEIRFLNDGASGGIEVWVDGDKIGTDLDQDTSADKPDNMQIGGLAGSISPNGDFFYIDDIKADTSYIGAYSAEEDEEYPIFSNYWDNNATLVDSGLGLFNVTVINTNGTVWLEIDGNNITAQNITADVYNASASLTSGTYIYYWHSWGNGSSHNYNQSVAQSYTVNTSADTTPPYFIDGTPTNQTIAYETALAYNINATDETAFDCFAVNDTNFQINCSGYLQNNTILGVALYNLNITINDSSNNLNSTLMWVNVTQIASLINLTFNETTPQDYGTQLNTTCEVLTGEGTAVLTLDGTTITSGSVITMNASTHSFNCSYSSTQNYSASSNTSEFVINKIYDTADILLNGVESNLSVIYPQQINVSVSNNNTAGTITINGTTITSATNYTWGVGIWEVNVSLAGDQNYTANLTTWRLEVNQTTSLVNLTLNNTQSNTTIVDGGTIDLNCSTITGDSSAYLLLYREGTLINNGTSPIGNTTTFSTVQVENITCAYENTQNYSISYETWWVDVTAAPDIEYPNFSSFWDNNATLVGSGTGLFNVTVTRTNGTVGIEFDGTNYSSENITASVYNASISIGSDGVYNYYWWSYGNGTSENYNISATFSYTVNVTPDTTPPTFDNLRNFTQEANISFSQSITASDDVDVDSYIFNQTNYFSINQATGAIVNVTNLSRIEIHWLNLTVNDTSNNLLSGLFYINLTTVTPPPAVTYSNITKLHPNVPLSVPHFRLGKNLIFGLIEGLIR